MTGWRNANDRAVHSAAVAAVSAHLYGVPADRDELFADVDPAAVADLLARYVSGVITITSCGPEAWLQSWGLRAQLEQPEPD